MELGIETPGTSAKYSELSKNIEKILFHIAFVKLTFIEFTSSTLTVTAINLFLIWALSLTIFQHLLCAFIQLISLEIHDKCEFHLIPIRRLPYNSKTLFGYAFALSGMFASTYASLMVNSPLISFMVGACWLIIAFVKDIQSALPGFECEEKTQNESNICEALLPYHTTLLHDRTVECENGLQVYLRTNA